MNSYGSFFLLHFEGLDPKEIDKCIGDPDADVDNTVLRAEQYAQVRPVTATNIKTATTIIIKIVACVAFYIHLYCVVAGNIKYIAILVSDWQRLSW